MRLFSFPALVLAHLLLVPIGSLPAQGAQPGPYEILPFEEGFIVEAFTDLLPSPNNSIADWTGWTSSQWISPNAYNNHGGTDFSAASGTPIYAATAGTVVALENTQPANSHNAAYYYGNYVKIRSSGGTSPRGENLDILTAHMLPNIQVSLNQTVNAGQLLGYSDNTGNSTSEHVHVESSLSTSSAIQCGFYHGQYKYPIMFTPNGKTRVGHVVRVKVPSTPIRSDMRESASQIAVAHQDQLYYASFHKRGFYRIFIPSQSGVRSAWIRALDVDDVLTGTVVQPLPDAGPYAHNTMLNAQYTLRSTPDTAAAATGTIHYAGGRFVADQTAPGGWYRIPVPGPEAQWGWVQADQNLLVYPQLYNPNVNLAAIPSNEFPIAENFATEGPCMFGKPKFDRCSVVTFSPPSPGGDGKALLLTDAINTGQAAYETISVGLPHHRNYFVECDVYFRFNPPYGTYERYGIFIRDDSFGGWDGEFEGAGNCYAMTWDSDDGYLRFGRVIEGAITDFGLSSQTYIPSSGWRRMRIETEGTTIRYYLDGTLRHTATDNTFISGSCGLGYNSYIGNTYPPARGAYFDNFRADYLPGYSGAEDWNLY